MSHAIAMIGLGKMGGNMARRLAQGGVNVHGFDVNLAAAQQLAAEENNITAHADLASLVAAYPPHRLDDVARWRDLRKHLATTVTFNERRRFNRRRRQRHVQRRTSPRGCVGSTRL